MRFTIVELGGWHTLIDCVPPGPGYVLLDWQIIPRLQDEFGLIRLVLRWTATNTEMVIR